jgi:hypothetical protein
MNTAQDVLRYFEETEASTSSDGIRVAFAQNKSAIDPYFENNRAELDKLTQTIREINAAKDSKVTGVIIVGFASPEGTALVNYRLAGERMEAVGNYLSDKQSRSIPVKMFNAGMNYQGLRQLVAASDMPSRNRVLNIIDNVPIWDSNRKVGRLGELMRLDGGAPYRYMYNEFFPQLRVATYVKVLYDNK